ncbi:MAG: type II toxin-antitoxin system Phd/YefM family antitoxin [Prosthecobacter sp.]|nr:type II toxin-antitoxin system Phd/YefM family antitoxin [Prosthecobacter sp.]
MITVNMHEAKTQLSKLVRAVVERGETVILQQNGKPVAEIHVHRPAVQPVRRLMPDPALKVTLAPGYDPAEPASEDEWPEECR